MLEGREAAAAVVEAAAAAGMVEAEVVEVGFEFHHTFKFSLPSFLLPKTSSDDVSRGARYLLGPRNDRHLFI